MSLQRNTYRDLPIELRSATVEDVDRFGKIVSMGLEEEPNFWLFKHIILKPAAVLPRLIVCSSQDSEAIYGRLLLTLDSHNQVNVAAPVSANIDNIKVYGGWEKKGVCDAMVEYSENLAVKQGFDWLEIGVTQGNVGPLSNYVRRHFHEHGMGIPCESTTARYFDVETAFGKTWVETPRYVGPSVVCYKSLTKGCVEHNSEDIARITATLLKLLP